MSHLLPSQLGRSNCAFISIEPSGSLEMSRLPDHCLRTDLVASGVYRSVEGLRMLLLTCGQKHLLINDCRQHFKEQNEP